VVRDSAGIAIVENPSAASRVAPIAFASRFSVDIGGETGTPGDELENLAATDVIRLASGRLAVPNGHEVRFYSADGRLVARAGRRGEGPGEFRAFVWGGCELHDQSFLALEMPTPRITRLSQDGKVLGMAPITATAIRRTCIGNAFLAALGPLEGRPASDSVTDYALINSEGRQIRRFAGLPTRPQGTLFPHEPLLGAGAWGIAAAWSSRHEYRLYDLTGRLRRIVRTDDRPRTLSDDEFAAHARARAGADASRAEQERAIAMLRARGLSRAVPSYVLLHVDGARRVWLQEPRITPGTMPAWVVFDADGRLLGRVVPQVPVPRGAGRVMVLGWTDREAIVTYQDADGFAHIALLPYALTPRRAP
jgi:hypothetical protein